MEKTTKEETAKLVRLADSIIDDIQEMSDEEIFELAIENFGGIEQVITKFDSAVEKGEEIAKVRRFEAAQKRLEVNRLNPHSINIATLPIDRKKTILEMAQRNGLISTLAARNATDYEADIDTMLEDLVELGMIDENGNPL